MWCVYTRRSTPDHPFLFADLLGLQDEILSELKTKPLVQQKAMIFAEVNPVVTLGARQAHDPSQRVHLEALRGQLNSRGIDVHSGERGGKETWHGPGQWVGFVVTPLELYTGEPRAVRKAVYQILQSVLNAIIPLDSTLKIEDDDRLGIWSSVGKVVSIGIKVREGFITSGFAVNCVRHETSFYGIDPCGLSAARADFLFKDDSISVAEERFLRLPARLISQF